MTFGQGDVVLDSLTKRIGFRTVELIQEPLEESDRYGKGTTFLFEVNGVRMFMGGTDSAPLCHSIVDIDSLALSAQVRIGSPRIISSQRCRRTITARG